MASQRLRKSRKEIFDGLSSTMVEILSSALREGLITSAESTEHITKVYAYRACIDEGVGLVRQIKDMLDFFLDQFDDHEPTTYDPLLSATEDFMSRLSEQVRNQHEYFNSICGTLQTLAIKAKVADKYNTKGLVKMAIGSSLTVEVVFFEILARLNLFAHATVYIYTTLFFLIFSLMCINVRQDAILGEVPLALERLSELNQEQARPFEELITILQKCSSAMQMKGDDKKRHAIVKDLICRCVRVLTSVIRDFKKEVCDNLIVCC